MRFKSIYNALPELSSAWIHVSVKNHPSGLGESKILYVGDKQYQDPYNNLSSIETIACLSIPQIQQNRPWSIVFYFTKSCCSYTMQAISQRHVGWVWPARSGPRTRPSTPPAMRWGTVAKITLRRQKLNARGACNGPPNYLKSTALEPVKRATTTGLAEKPLQAEAENQLINGRLPCAWSKLCCIIYVHSIYMFSRIKHEKC